MMFKFVFSAALSAAAMAAVVQDPGSVGPLAPEKDPRVSLEESIRRMRLSVDRELVYLARMEEITRNGHARGMVARQLLPLDEETDSTFGGFTDKVNDGTDVFRPIRPGTQVPSARQAEADDDTEASPTDDPFTTDVPEVTDDPMVSQPGNMRPGNNRPGNNRPGNMRPGNNRPGNMRPGNNRPGQGGSGSREPPMASPGSVPEETDDGSGEGAGGERPGSVPEETDDGSEGAGGDRPDGERPDGMQTFDPTPEPTDVPLPPTQPQTPPDARPEETGFPFTPEQTPTVEETPMDGSGSREPPSVLVPGGGGDGRVPSASPMPDVEETPVPQTVENTPAPVTTDETSTTTSPDTEPSVDPVSDLPGAIGDATDDGDIDLFSSPEDDDDDVCFPAHATVQLEDGIVKKMADIQLGDRVLVGDGKYSEVFMFTHKMSSVRHSFVELHTSTGHNVALTEGHYLYVNGKLAVASTVRRGDLVALGEGRLTSVSDVKSVISTGLYNPQTVHGDIIVNGLRASTYTLSVQPKMAHALLAPLRAMYDHVGVTLSAFEMGAGYLASLVPSGSLVQ